MRPFAGFCQAAWQASMDLVDEVRKRQQARKKKDHKLDLPTDRFQRRDEYRYLQK
jgi:hypothetical protein